MKKRTIMAALVLCITLVLSCSLMVAAADMPCDLTIRFAYEDEPIPGCVFLLYRVADVNEDMEFTVTAPFAAALEEGQSLEDAALQLSIHGQTLGLPAEHTLTTDETGTAQISGLPSGGWLLVGQPAVVGDMTYYVDPQVVCLPQRGVDGAYEHEVTVLPKSTQLPAQQPLVERTVVKIWDDKGYEAQRPGSITVCLCKDGTVVDRVALSAENDWSHTWSQLLPNANWTVEEEVPEHYVSELQESEGVFTLTNHRKTIDQTGHIWWPVVVMVAVGLVLVVLGVVLRRSGRHEA